MKITFRTDYDGFIHYNNEEVVNGNTLSVDGLETARDIAQHQHQSVFKLLSHKTMFIALPADKVNDKDYYVAKVLLVKKGGELMVWSVKYGYLTIENKDILFTTEDEATKYVEKQETYDNMVILKSALESDLAGLKKEIEKLGVELGK